MPRTINEIQADITRTEADTRTALARAAEGLALLDAADAALRGRVRERLRIHGDKLIAAIDELPRAAAVAWTDLFWANFGVAMTPGLATSVRVGGIVESDSWGHALNGLPLTVPVLASQGPLLLLCDEASAPAALLVMRTLLLRLALTMPGESRFTLLDPLGLGSAFPMRALLPAVRPTGRSAADELNDVLADIRRVNEAVVQHADGLVHLSADARAGEPFEFVAAVDFPEAYRADPRAVESLVKIGNSGARAGRYLLMVVRMDQPMPRDFDPLTAFRNAATVDLRGLDSRQLDELPPAADQKRFFAVLARESNRSVAGDWASVVKPAELWQETSERRVETPVGERLRIWFGRADDGNPSAHGMLAGQVGSGKSYLLHVVVTGLAARYSPDELKLYLIDGKHGVEFETYRRLPHAAVVCLRTSPEMARSVVEDFAAEMQHRYALFQKIGVADLELYRAKTGEKLPRLLMIVDEYQQLLAGDPDRGAALLSQLAEKGRAAGVHLLLGSQNFSAPGLPSSFFNHIHLRAALSLSSDYVQGLQLFGPEGRRLIRDLPASGYVVINDESGRDGANDRGAVARLARDDGPHSLRAIVAWLCEQGGSSEPVCIDGRDPATLQDNPFLARFRHQVPDADTLQRVARTSVRDGGFGIATWSKADRPIPLWVGRRFDVRGHHCVALTRLPGQNLLILGQQGELRFGMLAAALAALPAFVPPQDIRVDIVAGLRPGMAGEGMLEVAADLLNRLGVPASQRGDAELPEVLAEYAAELERRQREGAVNAPSRLMVVTEPEYLTSLAAQTQAFGPPPAGAPAQLRDLLARGSQVGLHVAMSASNLGTLQTILHPTRELRSFTHRICQQMTEDESMTLFGALVGARIGERTEHPTACVAVNTTQGVRAPVFFKAYAPAVGLDDSPSPETLSAILQTALAPKSGAEAA